MIDELAKAKGWNAAFMRAISLVESSGNGFYPDGFPKVRFEPHVFNRISSAHMPYTDGGRGFSRIPTETNRAAFVHALSLDRIHAIEATSFGAFQLMGFNWKRCGATSQEHFFEMMHDAEKQLDAFMTFLAGDKRYRTILEKTVITQDDCKAFAKAYNGSSNTENYATKLWAKLAPLQGELHAA